MFDRKKKEIATDPNPTAADDPGATDRLRTNEARQDDSRSTSDIARTGRRDPNAPAQQREDEARRAEQANAAMRSRELEQAHADEAQRIRRDDFMPPRERERVEGHPAGAAGAHDGDLGMLFTPQMLRDLRERWTRIQTNFVDEPRKSVEEADHLVAEAVRHLAETFSGARNKLEAQWDREGQVSTEDLRQVLRRYRTFFDRLLSV